MKALRASTGIYSDKSEASLCLAWSNFAQLLQHFYRLQAAFVMWASSGFPCGASRRPDEPDDRHKRATTLPEARVNVFIPFANLTRVYGTP